MRLPTWLVALSLILFMGTSVTAKAVDGDACRDPELVAFTMNTPYTAEVAALVPSVWIPHFLVPCPAVGWAIGQSQLAMELPDSRSQNVALLHSAAVILIYLPAVFSIIGIPLLMIEQLYIAPVSIMNALDRDVRCARKINGMPVPMPAPGRTTTTTPPTTTTPRPAERPRLDPTPPRRDEPLPPPAPPKFKGTDPEGPRDMAW
jgi:hypothetical protein